MGPLNRRTTYDPHKRLRVPFGADRNRAIADLALAEAAFAAALARLRPRMVRSDLPEGSVLDPSERECNRSQRLQADGTVIYDVAVTRGLIERIDLARIALQRAREVERATFNEQRKYQGLGR